MCIGCGACIDACNQVMEKVDYPKGLIRYTTERAIEDQESNQSAIKHILRPRVLIYTAFITVLTSAFLISLATRNPLRVDIMRDRGALAREVDGERIENIYRIQIMNASEHPMKVQVKATGLDHLRILDSQGREVAEIDVAPASNQLIPIKVSTEIDESDSGNHPIYFDVIAQEFADNKIIIRTRNEKSTFIIPR
jgi:polyferredoxin